MLLTRLPLGSAQLCGNRPEIVGIEAGAADQRAVDLGQAENRGGVIRIDRSAIEDPGARGIAARIAACIAAMSAVVAVSPVPIAQTGS